MKQVNAYMASDGSLHADAESCITHELSLGLRPLIDTFFDEATRYRASNVRSGYMQLLLRWEAFKLRREGAASKAESNVG
ncbi:hypothetical protein ACI2VR_09575 [Ralstonia nicotianae]|uniref:hypothetical protein n=1 Tax=Ralstonia pseudosolanacearum TaxID=1310165 RepID=UPI0016773401|nr:hypothetical protein [Ralstonia pseudosolanacearum]QWQ12203.1 hypothetical protein KN198_01085 [Ralstonia solanacearum]